jgi:hypothetical protein
LSSSPSSNHLQHDSETANQTSEPTKDVQSSAAPPGTTLPLIETVTDQDDDFDIDDFSNSSLDDLFDTDFTFNEGFGINSIRTDHSPATPCSDVLPDDELDTNDTPFPVSNTPRKDFLDSLEPTTGPLSNSCLLHQVLSDTVTTSPPAVYFDGPRGHLDNGAQASTTHDALHLHGYRKFTPDRPCRTRMIPADGHFYTPIGCGILCIPAPSSLGYIPPFYPPDRSRNWYPTHLEPLCIPTTTLVLSPSLRTTPFGARKVSPSTVFSVAASATQHP